MKPLKAITPFVFILLFISYASGDTIVQPGSVSGVWSAAGSPYLVQGDILVRPDSTLTIESGVIVVFQGHYRFNVSGDLMVQGTAEDSVMITAANTEEGWFGIRYTDGGISNSLAYCTIEYGKANGTISEDKNGGAISSANTDLEIDHCNIRGCFALQYGGGIYSNSSNLIMHESLIHDNSGNYSGGGLYSTGGSTHYYEGCSFISNHANGGGGGISIFTGADTELINCFIAENTVPCA